MVAPITGPFNSTMDFPSYYRFQARYRQKKPYNLPLTYTMRSARLVASAPAGSVLTTNSVANSHHGNVVRTQVANACYDKFVAEIGSRASLGVTFAQTDQALDMIANRTMQLYQFVRHLRRFEFRLAADVLRLATIPPKVGRHKSFAQNWLEFYFGWSPLVKDIAAAVTTLVEPVVTRRIRVSRSGVYQHLDSSMGGTIKYQSKRDSKIYVLMQADIRCENRNVSLANQLGLTNPLVILYDVTPWSFVANWFINIESYLAAGTAFYGLSVSNAFTTYYQVGTAYEWNYNPFRGANAIWEGSWVVNHVDRSLGLTTPSLTLRPYKPVSWERGLTAVSLLLQGSGAKNRY